jgi:hypothetical protein
MTARANVDEETAFEPQRRAVEPEAWMSRPERLTRSIR